MRERRFIRILLLAALMVSMFLLYIWSSIVTQRPVALAHAFVIGSDPIDGSTVTSVPKVVRIFFDTPISPVSIAYVYTPDEHMVASHSTISSADPRELDTPLVTPDQLPQGSYTVRWTALANIDGHTTHGVIGFNVGFSSTGLPGQTILGPSTSNILPVLDLIGVLAVAWEWLVLMALTFWIGILVTEGLILAGVERTAALFVYTHKQARPLQWLCLIALLVGEIITLILRTTQLTQSLNGSGINLAVMVQLLTRTTYGYLWMARLALIVGSLGLLWWSTRKRDSTTNRTRLRQRPASSFSRIRQRITQEQGPAKEEPAAAVDPLIVSPSLQRDTIVWLVLAGLILLTLSLSSDAAQLAQPPISTIVLDWLYLAARSIWLGGLAYLGYVLLPLLPVVEPDRHSEVLTTLLRRFQPLMLGTLGVLLVSGLYLGEASVTSAQQLLNDPYGRTLLVECALVLIMVLLSVYALFTLQPKLVRQAVLLPVVNAEMPARRARQTALEQTARWLKQVLRVVSWLGAAILLCAALMSFYAPPPVFPPLASTQSPSVAPTATSSTIQTQQTQQVGNLSITLEVLPARVNYANTVIVLIEDKSNGNLITDAQIQIRINMVVMDMGTVQQTLKGGNPTYIATFPQDTTFSMPGAWTVTLNIQRPHQPPVQATFTVTLGEA